MLIITALYASGLALVCLVLAVAVIKQRRAHGVSIADGNNKEVARAMRAHANFVEYVPLALILLAVAETNRANACLLHILGAILLIGRAWHAHGFLTSRAAIPKGRFYGTIMTVFAILGLMTTNVFIVIQHYL